MEPIDREDSSTYVNSPQVQPEAPQPVVQPVEPPKKKKSRAAAILALLLLLALVSAVALGWALYQQNGRMSDLETDLSKARNDVSRLESAAKAEANLDSAESVTTDTDSSSSDAIIEVALAYAKAEKNASDIEAKLVKQVGDFAQVSVTTNSAGYGMILKKSDNQWVVITAGQSAPSQDVIDRYGIPSGVITS